MSPNPAQVDKPEAVNYWDEPPEKQLEGKTLSKLDLSALGHVEVHNHHKDAVIKEHKEAPRAPGTYWEDPPEKQLEGKTLSKLDLQNLGHVEEHSHHKMESPSEPAQPASPTRAGGGSISDLQHKGRTDWKASYRRMSDNTLAKLDETADMPIDAPTVTEPTPAEDDFVMPQRNDSFIMPQADGF